SWLEDWMNEWAKGEEHTFSWQKGVHSGPMNICGLCYLLASPIMLLLGVLYHRRTDRETEAEAEAEAETETETSPSLSECQTKLHTLTLVSRVLMGVGLVACLPTRMVQDWIVSHLGLNDLGGLDDLGVDFGSYVHYTLYALLGGSNMGLFPFLTPALIGLAMGLRLRAVEVRKAMMLREEEIVATVEADSESSSDSASPVKTPSPMRTEMYWALLCLCLGAVVAVYEVVATGWSPNPEDDFRDPGPAVTLLQTALQIAGCALMQKVVDNAKNLGRLVTWSKVFRIFSTYSVTVYVLNMGLSVPIRVFMSQFSDQCDFIGRYDCYVYSLAFLEMLLAGLVWYGALLLLDLVKGVLSLDWCISALGRAVFALGGRATFRVPNMRGNHCDIIPVTPYRQGVETERERADVVQQVPTMGASPSGALV
ncbi:hypothetical protein KIPB_006451, partial [Kipferlia bialata]